MVVGGGGPLGSAVLEQLLGSGQWIRVAVLDSQPLEVSVSGLDAWPATLLNRPAVAGGPRLEEGQAIAPDPAVLVFDRQRSRHGREAALYRPDPAQLPALALGLLLQAWLGGQAGLVLPLPLPRL